VNGATRVVKCLRLSPHCERTLVHPELKSRPDSRKFFYDVVVRLRQCRFSGLEIYECIYLLRDRRSLTQALYRSIQAQIINNKVLHGYKIATVRRVYHNNSEN